MLDVSFNKQILVKRESKNEHQQLFWTSSMFLWVTSDVKLEIKDDFEYETEQMVQRKVMI